MKYMVEDNIVNFFNLESPYVSHVGDYQRLTTVLMQAKKPVIRWLCQGCNTIIESWHIGIRKRAVNFRDPNRAGWKMFKKEWNEIECLATLARRLQIEARNG